MADGPELWLVRHAESTGNRDGILQGQDERPLSERGRKQAQRLGGRLLGIPFVAAYASDLERARDTAAIALADRLAVRCEPGLREMDAGSWTGLTAIEIRDRHPQDWAAWERDRDPDLRRGGGESYRMAQARMAEALTAVVRRHPQGPVLVVTHGGVLRAWVCGMLGLDLRQCWRLQFDNTGVTRIRPEQPVGPGLVGRVVCINDLGHLEG
jgi:broad specificity phosphatase PhoE